MIRAYRTVFPPMNREELERQVGGSMAIVLNRRRQLNSGLFGEHFANAKIFYLSELPDSIVMWSHYAQNHSGIVLRFTDDTSDNPLTKARPVRYVDQMPSLFNEESLSDMLAGYGGLDHQKIMDEVVWTKSTHWAHEREWRIYAGDGRFPGAPQ